MKISLYESDRRTVIGGDRGGGDRGEDRRGQRRGEDRRGKIRSRLADYLVNCWTTAHTGTTCPNQDNHQACLASYARLIGTEMTPNYVDSSFSNWTISPWCTCKGSGNHEEDCMDFLRYFTENTCLRSAIQAYGYGIDNMQNKSAPVPGPSAVTKTGWDWSTGTSEPPFVAISKYPGRWPEQDPSLSKTQGLLEDHATSICANVWALLPGLALALVLAQHAL
ncbi:unnamed protein product [Pleuronectes platessa]|uniref:GDNF/GAS1 domain-containing protein n=1 Tax=Pleuronectes platessa TaxID=8262 RepID=A0A9N7VDY0_PLEPL|nr:unnamed protein product [Pleuronectes platessa]